MSTSGHANRRLKVALHEDDCFRKGEGGWAKQGASLALHERLLHAKRGEQGSHTAKKKIIVSDYWKKMGGCL